MTLRRDAVGRADGGSMRSRGGAVIVWWLYGWLFKGVKLAAGAPQQQEGAREDAAAPSAPPLVHLLSLPALMPTYPHPMPMPLSLSTNRI